MIKKQKYVVTRCPHGFLALWSVGAFEDLTIDCGMWTTWYAEAIMYSHDETYEVMGNCLHGIKKGTKNIVEIETEVKVRILK